MTEKACFVPAVVFGVEGKYLLWSKLTFNYRLNPRYFQREIDPHCIHLVDYLTSRHRICTSSNPPATSPFLIARRSCYPCLTMTSTNNPRRPHSRSGSRRFLTKIRICFPYLQKSGSRLALEFDITFETIPSPRQENPYSALPSSCLAHAYCPYNLHTMDALMSRSNPP